MRARHCFFASLLCCAAACGGAGPSPQSPELTTDSPTESVDELLSRLEASERQLEAELGTDAKSTPTTPSPAPAAEAEKEASGGQASEAPAEASPAKPEQAPAPVATAPPPSPCEVACKALGSMQRSAARICDLTGDEDTRCEGARARVTRAEDRVTRAGCGCDR